MPNMTASIQPSAIGIYKQISDFISFPVALPSSTPKGLKNLSTTSSNINVFPESFILCSLYTNYRIFAVALKNKYLA
jgi:hypothetical protein